MLTLLENSEPQKVALTANQYVRVDRNWLERAKDEKRINNYIYVMFALELERMSGKHEIDVAVFCSEWQVPEPVVYAAIAKLSKIDPSVGFCQLSLDLISG